jgi:molecular chaperone GrpE (heat shock protein)
METDAHSPAGRLFLEERERLVRGFEAWLDSALAVETPPTGLTAELLSALQTGDPLPPVDGGCDLYSLWSALTGLTQEVKLQGRTFQQLNDTLSRNLEAAAAERQAAAMAAESASETPRSTQAGKREIDVLLDLRDRVERGRGAAHGAAKELTPSRLPRLARWLGVGGAYARHTQEILAALVQGCSLTLDRIDQALQDLHVSLIVCVGQQFDPQRMTAIEVEETEAVPEGTVVEVHRNGYEWEGEVYRPAQVKVARRQERG